MATYTAITDAEIDQDSPITQTLMTKYRDNLTAVIEDDSTAPKIKQRMRYGQASNGGNITFSDLADYGGVEINAALKENSGSDPATLEIQYSVNSGSSYTAITDLLTSDDSPTQGAIGYGYFDFATGELSFVRMSDIQDGAQPGFSATVGGAPLAITNLRFSVSTGDRANVIIKAFGGIT